LRRRRSVIVRISWVVRRAPERWAPERSSYEGRAKEESATKKEWREAAKASVHEKPVVKERIAGAHESHRLARESSEDVSGGGECSNTRCKCARTNGSKRARRKRPSCGRNSPRAHRRSTEASACRKSTA